jgi:hypothetical protein
MHLDLLGVPTISQSARKPLENVVVELAGVVVNAGRRYA